jgi:hypothetical protein
MPDPPSKGNEEIKVPEEISRKTYVVSPDFL